MSNNINLFNKYVAECYKKMNLVPLDTKRNLDHHIGSVEGEDFETAAQLVQEYVFKIISEEDKNRYFDELRHYLYNSVIQRNIAFFSLCSPDSLRFLAGKYYGGEYSKIANDATIRFDEIREVGVATDYSIAKRLGVNLEPYDEDNYIDSYLNVSATLNNQLKDCNILRLDYSMRYCNRFTHYIKMFESHFSALAKETESVTAIILSLAAFGVRVQISYELGEFSAKILAYELNPAGPCKDHDGYVALIQKELDKFYKSYNREAPSVDRISAEILSGIK